MTDQDCCMFMRWLNCDVPVFKGPEESDKESK